MLAKPDDERPLFVSTQKSVFLGKKQDKRIVPATTKKLKLIDVIESMIDSGVHSSNRIFDVLMLMQN